MDKEWKGSKRKLSLCNKSGTKATAKKAVKPKDNQVRQGSTTSSKRAVTAKSKQEGNVIESKKSDKRKLLLNHDEPKDLDDSFETPMKTRRQVLVAEPKRKKSKCLDKRNDYQSITIRNPPCDLISVMKDFTVEQQNSVKKMGFESILGTTVGNMPNKLGYWLAKNYDPDSNTLHIGNKSLLITRQTVNDVYGFPMGNTPINALERASPDNVVVQEFQNQFSTKDGRARMSDVLPELVKDVTGGRKFILNFLVSVMTVFLGGTRYGIVNQKFLPDIQADTDIMDLDWCTYALECLNSGRKSWDFTKKNTCFTGPLLFLVVLYVSSTIVPGEIVERRFPLMNCWTTETLKEREAKEMLDGGFGKLKIADDVVYVDNDVDDEVFSHKAEKVLKSEDMAQNWDHNEALEFIPELTLSQYPPKQPIYLSENKFKNIIVAKSLHPTEFYGYTIRERFAKMGWEQLLDFECDKIYRRIVIDWTASLSRKGDELTGIVDGKPYTISPTIIRDLLKVDTRTDLPYARFNQADLQTITDENEIRWLEACKTVFGRELDKNVAISYLEMTPLVKILWGIGLWTFHPRLKYTNCVLDREIYLLHALYTCEYLYSFAHLMIDDIWSVYEDEYQQTIPHVYYLSEILTRLGAVSQDERIEVVDLSHRQITRSSFRDLNFSESPTRYIIYDRVLKQQVTFLKKAIEVEAPPQSPPHLMPIPNPHADETNNPKDLINTQLSQSQKQLDDMMSIVSNMQKQMEQQAFEAKCRDQERELLEQEREKRAQEREKQAEEREKRKEIQAHAMTNLQNLKNKQSEEQKKKMIMTIKNMQKQMESQASETERREQAREKREKERETQAEIKAHAMANNLQILISNQFEEQHQKTIVIVNNKEKQIECQALEAERREQAREKWEEEREKQAEIKARVMENNLQNLINKQFQEQHEKMIMIVHNMEKQIEYQTSETERQELAREKLEEEREKQAEIKARCMENNLKNLFSKQFQEQHDKILMIVNNMEKQFECQALEAERRELAREKWEEEREKQAEIKAHAMENNLQNLISKQFQEQYEKIIMIVNNKEKQIECQALEIERQELAREKLEEEREKQAEVKAHTMESNLQNLICNQFQELHEKMLMIVNNKEKQIECQALEAERRELAREKWEEEREKQAEIKAHDMESNLQNLINKQFQEQYKKMTMIVNNMLKQMECQALKAEWREEEREKQEQESEKREQIKAHAMANNLRNMISKQFQEQHEKMITIVNNMQKHMESQALAAEYREQKEEKHEEEREKRADIRAHAVIWDIERQRYLYEQEQRQLRMAWNQGNCVNGVDEFQFPQISHTSFHPPRVGSRYYDPTQSNEIPQAFRSLYHDIFGPRD